MMSCMKKYLVFISAILLLAFQACKGIKNNKSETNQQWQSLLAGNSLEGWVVKITNQPVGENYKNTFRVKDGVLSINYDEYDGFENSFGHIFYDKEFSNYRFRMEYRFIGNQLKGGAGWAKRNSGIMVHCEEPRQMGIKQYFPVSLEVQLLGGLDDGLRTTGNVCTPGTHVAIDGVLVKKHCISSKSKTYNGDQWVKVEIEVRNDSIIKHFINDELVMEYTDFELGGGIDANADFWKSKEGLTLNKGYISLQSESHPVEFKNIELLEL